MEESRASVEAKLAQESQRDLLTALQAMLPEQRIALRGVASGALSNAQLRSIRRSHPAEGIDSQLYRELRPAHLARMVELLAEKGSPQQPVCLQPPHPALLTE